LALVCGSLYLGLSSVSGVCMRIFFTSSSSPGRMGSVSYSAALHRISTSPFILVLAVSDELKSSMVE
jgi:hypothetical protein